MMNLFLKLLAMLAPKFEFNTMAQTAFPTFQGMNLNFELDDAAFRTKNGLTSGYASGLRVARFGHLGGFIWIGTGTPNGAQYSLTAYDIAYVADATTGATRWLCPAGAESTTWA